MTYDQLATDESISKTVATLKEHNVEAIVASGKGDAFELIKSLIPKGATVMNGTSKTLEEIGYIEHLKGGEHGWNNLHEAIVKEADKSKQALLRKQALMANYYLGSVHALSETGEFIVASNTASQLPHVVFSSDNVIFVVGAQKIVPNLPEAFKRLEEYVVPLEDARMKALYGPTVSTRISKILVFKYESPFVGRKVRMIIVKEKLGF